MKYAKGWVACIENKDGSRFPNGSLFLYSEPHPTEQQAQDWVWAHDSITKGGVNLVRMEQNDVPEERLVKPLDRKRYTGQSVPDICPACKEPCEVNYMEPSSREIYLSRVLCLHDELSGKKFPHDYWNGYHPRVYGRNIKDREADRWVQHLCDRCNRINVINHSLELQIWWRDHQAADRKREQDEKEVAELEIKRRAALSKLTPEDREVLGLE